MNERANKLNQIGDEFTKELQSITGGISLGSTSISVSSNVGSITILGPINPPNISALNFTQTPEVRLKKVTRKLSTFRTSANNNIFLTEERVASTDYLNQAIISGKTRTDSKGKAEIRLLDFISEYLNTYFNNDDRKYFTASYFGGLNGYKFYFYFQESDSFVVTTGSMLDSNKPFIASYSMDFYPPDNIEEIKEGYFALMDEYTNQKNIKEIWPKMAFPRLRLSSWDLKGEPLPNKLISWNCSCEIYLLLYKVKEQ